MTTGQRIKAARKAAGITQAELADRLGISYVGVSQWENDLRNPKIETIQRIADALDIPVGELLGTIPQPDRDFERVCDALDDAGLALEATGRGDGSGPDGDRLAQGRRKPGARPGRVFLSGAAGNSGESEPGC